MQLGEIYVLMQNLLICHVSSGVILIQLGIRIRGLSHNFPFLIANILHGYLSEVLFKSKI